MKMEDFVSGVLILIVVILIVDIWVMIPVFEFERHKHSLEHMVGHPVSNWDAFWTK